MKYEFAFYREEDYEDVLRLVKLSYKWDCPTVGLSRVEFAHGLNPNFAGIKNAWLHTVGVYRENGKIVACVWNEGTYDGEVFFLFDSKERGSDIELLQDMVKFAKTNSAGLKDDRRTRWVNLFIPAWNDTLKEYALNHGFSKTDYEQGTYILPFSDDSFEVNLPEGYTIIDGNTSPDFYLSNTHRLSFNYGGGEYAAEHGADAFHDLRKNKYYKKDLDLCVLDEQGRPVAMAIIWYDESMPYCELEPLGVVWWERRKGIATAILHEAANRVMKKYPNCKGMLGGDQEFYKRIGYEKKGASTAYYWEAEIFISWEKESYDKNYAKEVE